MPSTASSAPGIFRSASIARSRSRRLPAAFNGTDSKLLGGTVEVDETYMGCKRKNMSNAKRKDLEGRGTVGKTAVVGAKERDGRVKAQPVQSTDSETLSGFVQDAIESGSTVFTDGASAYDSVEGFEHDTVNQTLPRNTSMEKRTRTA